MSRARLPAREPLPEPEPGPHVHVLHVCVIVPLPRPLTQPRPNREPLRVALLPAVDVTLFQRRPIITRLTGPQTQVAGETVGAESRWLGDTPGGGSRAGRRLSGSLLLGLAWEAHVQPRHFPVVILGYRTSLEALKSLSSKLSPKLCGSFKWLVLLFMI